MLSKAAGLRAVGCVITLLSCSALAGCPVNEPAPPLDRDVSFSSDVQPILTERCVSCHTMGGFAFNVGIPLILDEGEAYAELVNVPSAQNPGFTFVEPSDAANSLLFRKVSEDDPPVGSTMPLFSARLSSEELGLIRDWIAQGALDN